MKRRNEYSDPETPVVNDSEAAPEVLDASALVPEPQLSVQEYAIVKKIDSRRVRGMEAFSKLQTATFEQWETIFKNY